MMMDRSITSQDATQDSDVVLSLPEVDALCTRAARGVGYSWGVSEECGRAAAWLAAHRFDWTPVLLRRLNGPRGGDVSPKSGKWGVDGAVCALLAGTTLADFAALPEGPGREGVEIGVVHDPLMALPFVAQAATVLGQTLGCYLDGTLWAQVSGSGVDVTASNLTLVPEASLALRPVATKPLVSSAPLAQTSAISRQSYDALTDLALRMTVPATAASETRAGADGSDND